MQERVSRELDLVEKRFGETQRSPQLDWFIVKRVPLGPGWNKDTTQILVLVPGGYHTTPPDNFYADPDLRLAGGSLPANTSADQRISGHAWLLFSYHVEAGSWHPEPRPEDGHNLATFIEGVIARLRETT